MKKISDVICPFCGCLCDDVSVTVENNRIVAVDNGCTLCEHKMKMVHQLRSPVRRKGDRWERISLDEALDYTVDMLASADRPLIFGWSGTHGEAQCIGIHMAELIRGVIDNTSTVCHGPSILAIQEVGHPGCTLGVVKNRADLVIYWGANPLEAHPRHMSRYTTYADGYFMENAFRNRKVIVVDVRETETAAVADEFIRIKPGGDYAVLSALRALIRGKGDMIPESVAGVQRSQLERVAMMCRSARFGALYFGLGLTMTRGKHKNVRNAIELVDELNRHTKFVITPMRGHWNVYGANEVFTWMGGYPYALDFTRGVAFYNPGETTSIDILARGECDACLVVASDPAAHFPRKAVEHLARIPVVQIDPVPNATTAFADVQIPVAISGIDADGTAYRMDGVPLRVKKILDTGFPTDTEIMKNLYGRLMDVMENGRAAG
ncbi:MAG: formylmethanofuran dehydrogenase subunit B [Methanoculleaceae archaeon]